VPIFDAVHVTNAFGWGPHAIALTIATPGFFFYLCCASAGSSCRRSSTGNGPVAGRTGFPLVARCDSVGRTALVGAGSRAITWVGTRATCSPKR